jgi:hypothetical protein
VPIKFGSNTSFTSDHRLHSHQFLLAYHYLTVGDAEAAKGALTRAKKLLPADPIITQLAEAAGVEGVRADPKAPAPATDVKLDISGAWTATRAVAPRPRPETRPRRLPSAWLPRGGTGGN